MNSTEPTWGIAWVLAISDCTWSSVAVFCTYATTWTFDSTNERLARRTFWRMKKPARRRSIRTIVSVAARLISALRQNPCHARRIENRTKGITPRSVLAVVGGAGLVADDPPVLEGDDPLAQRRHDLRVVGRHEDRDAQL